MADGFVQDLGAVRKGTETVNSSYYRPIFVAWSTIYYQVAGPEPAGWHRACVFLAALLGALTCLFFLRLGVAGWLALAGSLVFSLHPSHTSSVAWAAGLQELGVALFVLLALHGVLSIRERAAAGRPWRAPLVATAAAFLAAILSKEVGLGLLPFFAAWYWLERREAQGPALLRLLQVAGGLGALYLLARLAVLGGKLALPAENAPGFFAALPAVPLVLATYLRLLLWPFEFAILRPERPFHTWLSPAVLAAVAALLIAAGAAFWAIGRRRELALPLAFFLALLVPVLNVWVLDPQWIVTDRYLFLPSLALPWLILLLPRSEQTRRMAMVALLALALAYAAFDRRYAAIFADQPTFLAAMEIAEPTSILVLTEKARLLGEKGDHAGARAAYTRAAEFDPLAAIPLERLGDYALQAGELDAAEEYFRRALVVRPYASRGFKLVALARAQRGDRARGAALIAESAERWPEEFQVQLLHALFLAADGQEPASRAAFDKAVALRPGDPAVAGGYEAALARLRPSLGARP